MGPRLTRQLVKKHDIADNKSPEQDIDRVRSAESDHRLDTKMRVLLTYRCECSLARNSSKPV